MPQRPNIVYVFADQMRASALGCMDAEPVHTPNLDRMAGEGVLFRNAVANTPVCTPSRASLITGKHAWSARCIVNDLRLPPEERSIAHAAREAGYRTGYVGKWHLDGISRHMYTPPGPRRHGFDDYWAAYNCNHNYSEARWFEDDDPTLHREARYDADVQTDQAIGFMERFRDEPFCLFLSWGPPHDPYHLAPQDCLALYPPDEIKLPVSAEGADPASLAGYYAHVTALDRDMGRIMATLDRLGLADNTILVFSADHGDMLWAHGRVNKQQPFEESVHIPLIIRWPNALPSGQQRDTVIGVVDHAPTLLGLAGITPPAEMNGLDLSGLLTGAGGDEPTAALIGEYVSFDQGKVYQPWRGVRTRQYTYARWLRGGAVLFDNLADPYQLRNLLWESGHEALQSEMEAELQTQLERIADPFVTGNEHIRALGQWEEWQIRQEHFYGFGTTNF